VGLSTVVRGLPDSPVPEDGMRAVTLTARAAYRTVGGPREGWNLAAFDEARSIRVGAGATEQILGARTDEEPAGDGLAGGAAMPTVQRSL